MGQLFLVHGRDSQVVRRVFAAGLAHLKRLGATPAATIVDAGTTLVAECPRRHAPASLAAPAVPLQATAEAVWTVSAGCWLASGRSDAASLSRLGGALADSNRRWGEAAAALDGFFALACGDAAGRELHVATDRTGSLHLYRTRVEGCEVLGTSSLALAALAGAGFDPVAVREFLGTGSVFEERSLHAGVEKLPPSTVLRFREGRLVARERWWELRPLLWGSAESRAHPGDVPALAAALTGTLDALLAAYPGAVLDLTGGFDSRAVLGAALATGRPFRTVVVGADDDPDVIAAGGIARDFDLAHTHLVPGRDYGARSLADLRAALALCDGEADVVEYAGIAQIQARMAGAGGADGAGGLTVNGSSGELCRGYWWDLLPSLDAPGSAFDSRRAATGRFATDGWADAMLARDAVGGGAGAAASLADHFTAVVERSNAELRDLPAVALADNTYLTLRMQRWAGRLVSATDRIWPCISPFMFEAPMRASLSAPPALRRRDRMTRALIEHLNPRLAALPMADGSPALPLRAGTLHRFGPHAAALGGKAWGRVRRRMSAGAGGGSGAPAGETVRRLLLNADVVAMLEPLSMQTRGLYDAKSLADFVLAAQTSGSDHPRRAGRVLTLELVAKAVSGTI